MATGFQGFSHKIWGMHRYPAALFQKLDQARQSGKYRFVPEQQYIHKDESYLSWDWQSDS